MLSRLKIKWNLKKQQFFWASTVLRKQPILLRFWGTTEQMVQRNIRVFISKSMQQCLRWREKVRNISALRLNHTTVILYMLLWECMHDCQKSPHIRPRSTNWHHFIFSSYVSLTVIELVKLICINLFSEPKPVCVKISTIECTNRAQKHLRITRNEYAPQCWFLKALHPPQIRCDLCRHFDLIYSMRIQRETT